MQNLVFPKFSKAQKGRKTMNNKEVGKKLAHMSAEEEANGANDDSKGTRHSMPNPIFYADPAFFHQLTV